MADKLKIAVVDDESSSIELLTATLEELLRAEKPDIISFMHPARALEYLLSHAVDVVFLDIEMPVISGVDIAERLVEQGNAPEVIFVTAYPQYSLDAWKLDAADYILKPYDPKQISKALQRSLMLRQGKRPVESSSRPYIRCFSDFDVLIGSDHVKFQSKRARELLALLVHHQGSWVSIGQISYELLEEAPETAAKNYIRMLLTRLRKTLAQNGISDILESHYGEVRVDPDAFDCDYYDYLNGKPVPYRGRYMGDYPWAQDEAAYLLNERSK